MKKIIALVVIVIMLAYALFDFFMKQDIELAEEEGLEIGMIAPDFELNTLTGEQVRLSEYRGKKVFVNFWATWCPPCRAEMPDMQKLYENADNIEILAVNLTDSEHSVEGVNEFVTNMGLTFPILLDEKGSISSLYNVYAYPTSYLIDTNGRIQHVAMGAMNYDMMVQEFGGME